MNVGKPRTPRDRAICSLSSEHSCTHVTCAAYLAASRAKPRSMRLQERHRREYTLSIASGGEDVLVSTACNASGVSICGGNGGNGDADEEEEDPGITGGGGGGGEGGEGGTDSARTIVRGEGGEEKQPLRRGRAGARVVTTPDAEGNGIEGMNDDMVSDGAYAVRKKVTARQIFAQNHHVETRFIYNPPRRYRWLGAKISHSVVEKLSPTDFLSVAVGFVLTKVSSDSMPFCLHSQQTSTNGN